MDRPSTEAYWDALLAMNLKTSLQNGALDPSLEFQIAVRGMQSQQGRKLLLAFSWAQTEGGASTLALCRDRSGRMLSRQQDEHGPVIDEPLEPKRWGKLKEIKKRKFNKSWLASC